MIPWLRARRRSLVAHAGLALLAYVPLLLTQPGWVGADTKSYLYLDPGRLLRRAPFMWDPHVGMGTVTHQTIGYLFPMGPYYWVTEQLGLPDWVAQRLWLGTILFAAGAGVLFLGRALAWRGAGPLVAALAYMLSPYSLATAARISVILLPWAALPWMIGIVIRALRQGGWRWPAGFALVVAVVGGVNATALIYAGIGPVLWFPFAVWVTREVTLRHAMATAARIGALTLAVSLWWIAALSVQSRYGLPVLAFSETFDTVAATASAPEVLRGLGYWFFYGGDKLGPWVPASVQYRTRLWLLSVSLLLPTLAFAAAAVTRWRHRAYFVALTLVGTIVGVASFPFDDPSPVGAAFKDFATSSTAGLALRSHARAVPLVVLGIAGLLGAGITALSRRITLAGVAAAVAVALLAIANLPPLWQGELVNRDLRRREDLPSYWEDAIAYLDGRGDGSRILEIPGADFASYRWGGTVDIVTPGLTDRPVVARELIPFGSPPSADLLIALDRRMQEGIFEPAALAPIARLMGVGDILLRSDIERERYRTASPHRVWAALTPSPDGLLSPDTFGGPAVDGGSIEMIDAGTLGVPSTNAAPPRLASFGVRRPRDPLRAELAERPLVVAGSAEGLVDAAAEGLVPQEAVILYGATLTGEEGALDDALAAGADLLITDTNRHRPRRWSTLWWNTGFTAPAADGVSGGIVRDVHGRDLDVFPDADADSYTVTEHRGGATVSASAYGSPIWYSPDQRPVLAMDGDERTAWRVGDEHEALGERLVVHLDEPVRTDRITLLQPVTGPRTRWITEVALRFDGGPPTTVPLSDASREAPGQTVTFDTRSFSTIEIEITGDNIGERARWDGVSAAGFAEVGIGDPPVRVEEVVRPPVDVLQMAGRRTDDHRLGFLFTRQRSDPADAPREDEEPAMVRALQLPSDRSFSVLGTARLSADRSDEQIDALLGIPPATENGVTARSSARLAGSLRHRASATIDGDGATSWSPPLGEQRGHWIELETGTPVTVDRLDLQLVADGRHSVPTRLAVSADGGDPVEVEIPPVADQDDPGAVVPVSVELPEPLTATRLRVTVADVREAVTREWFSFRDVALPVGMAEVGIAGVRSTPPPAALPAPCRGDLVAIDDRPVPVRVVGTTEAAAAREGLALELCSDPPAVDVEAGDHVLRTAAGRDTGIDVDRVALLSERGGGPVPLDEERRPVPAERDPQPVVEVLDRGTTQMRLRVDNPGEPFWVVLGQSHSEGWVASVDGRSLGEAVLVDGYANGWYVEPPVRPGPMTFTLTWRPQRTVWVGLAVSGLALVACLALVILDPRRRAAPAPRDTTWVFPAMPEDPELASPLLSHGPPPAAAVVGAGVGVIVAATALIVDPLLAVPVGLAGLAALVTRRGRAALTVGAVAALAVAALYVVVQQYRHDYPADFTWPQNFERVHLVAWTATALLGADALVERLRARRR